VTSSTACSRRSTAAAASRRRSARRWRRSASAARWPSAPSARRSRPVVGLGGAVVIGTAAFFLTRAVIGAPAAPVRTSDLLGVFGTVVTRIPVDGLGEVVLPQAGSRVKLAARSHEPVPSGTPVYVVEVLSATSVVVQRADLLPGSDPS
jgi:hypothetical protein